MKILEGTLALRFHLDAGVMPADQGEPLGTPEENKVEEMREFLFTGGPSYD